MNEQVKDIIAAIQIDDTIAAQAAFSSAVMTKVAEKVEARRQEIAQSMFANESVELDEATVTVHGPRFDSQEANDVPMVHHLAGVTASKQTPVKDMTHDTHWKHTLTGSKSAIARVLQHPAYRQAKVVDTRKTSEKFANESVELDEVYRGEHTDPEHLKTVDYIRKNIAEPGSTKLDRTRVGGRKAHHNATISPDNAQDLHTHLISKGYKAEKTGYGTSYSKPSPTGTSVINHDKNRNKISMFQDKPTRESVELDEAYVGTWHSDSYHKSPQDTDNGDGTHSRVMRLHDFHPRSGLGYEERDHEAIKALKPGQSYETRHGGHTITRI